MRGRFSRAASALAALTLLLVAPSAFAWWNDDWAFRKELTFDTSQSGANLGATVTDVPVLLRLSLANFTYFADAKPDGSDMRVLAADDKTPLKFHIEKYDAQAQMALIWVRLPQLAGGVKTDKIFLYYGNKSATSLANAADSYPADQALVFHFASASSGDSTANANPLQGLAAELTPASLIGSGIQFGGQQSYAVASSASLHLDPAKGRTVSVWIKPDGRQEKAVLVAQTDGKRELALAIEGGHAVARWRDAAGKEVVARQPDELADGWHHLALRVGAGKLALLVDGAAVAQQDATLEPLDGGLTLGQGYKGGMDELQVASVPRSDDWLRAAVLSQGMQASLVVYGGDSQKESNASQSYFASTLRNVTVDGWVIIGVLVVMFAFSMLIMVLKLLRLNLVARGNARFLTEFHNLRDDPAALERSENPAEGASSFGASTLWQLYHHGMRETMKRVEGQAAGADHVRSISPQAIEAIRATLDASLTRMTQKLQSQMVWLTISISGGPFLGLLGTVVGVMITFAAIAAAGEVNVNAIAPGTAAALVATVAGLGVAIPCLFGYNYLNTQIKNISTDMRVFVDEFVTRIAETYA